MKNIIQEANFRTERIPLSEFLKIFKQFHKQSFEELIKWIVKIAKKRNLFLYFAGGAVRDYYLNFPTYDLDLVVEGDLFSFLEELLKVCQGKILFKSQFLTAKVEFLVGEEKLYVDFITARKEKYPGIAKLPMVYPATFLEDIKRRDFTINSMIYGITPPFEEIVIDVFNGKKDLEERIIKPLKENSFVEDPTRAFRGIRYKVRFGFNYHNLFFKALELAFKNKAFSLLSPQRLANELISFLEKEPSSNLFFLLNETLELNIFQESGLDIDAQTLKKVSKFFNGFFNEFSKKQRKKAFLLCLSGKDLENGIKLGFTEKELKKYRNAITNVSSRIKEVSSEYEKLLYLEKLPKEVLPFLAVAKGLEKEVALFLTKYLKTKLFISGEDLKSLGVYEGKKIGEILKLVKKETFEGKITNKEQALLFVKSLLKK